MAGTDGSNGTVQGGDQPPRRRRRRRRRRPAATDRQRSASAGGGDGPSTPDVASTRSGRGKRSRGRKPTGAKKPAASQPRADTASKARKKKPTTARRKRPNAAGRKTIPTTREVSAGGVVYRYAEEGAIEVVLASRRTRRGQLAWGLAKGGIEPGESKEDAALREVREETGLTADIEADLGDTKYMYVWDDIRIRKTVHFFLMRHTGGDVEDRDDEMEEIRWFPLERAIKRAAYRGERDMLLKASELLR